MKYYSVEAQHAALAFDTGAPQRRFLDDLDFTPGLREDVPPIEWRFSEPGAPDWASTIERSRAVSTRARDLLEPLLGPRDRIQWLPATILTTTGEALHYWVMHFPDMPDPYDDTTVRGLSGIPMPGGEVLSRVKAEGHEVFAPPRESATVYVTEPVLRAIEHAGLTGWFAEQLRTI